MLYINYITIVTQAKKPLKLKQERNIMITYLTAFDRLNIVNLKGKFILKNVPLKTDLIY